MVLTRGQLGTRSLRSRAVTIKLFKKQLPVGRSCRKTTPSRRPRVSIQTDRTQSTVENNMCVQSLHATSSTHIWCSAPRHKSTAVLHTHKVLPGTIDDPRPSASSSLLLPATPAPSLQPDKNGRIAYGDFHKVVECFAFSVCLDNVVFVDEVNVGIPKDDAWDQFAAFVPRQCLEHGNEHLLGCYPRWMCPRDLHPSPEKIKEELAIKLKRYQHDPYDFETSSSRFRSDCQSTLWSQIDTPIAEGRCGDDVIFLIRWNLCWTPDNNIDDLGWVRLSHRVQEGRIGRRLSKRLEATAGMRAERTKSMAEVFKQIGELC
jgi:hypothetical protein